MSGVATGGIGALAERVRSGEVTAVETLEAVVDAIQREDAALGAFVRHFQAAWHRAESVDEVVAGGGDPGPLAGVPVAIKDNIAVAGEELTCGSRILRGYRSPFDATAVERLVAAGAVPIGHANMDEFGMGSSCENSAFGPTRNPWDRERVPGGSSGGSAAAVAAEMVPLALGSDTGGSIRQPAALCGVVGLKPTYGRVSRWGLVAFASSLDQIGPMAGSVADVSLALGVLAGADPRDSTCLQAPVDDYRGQLGADVEGLRIGVLKQFAGEDLPEALRANWAETCERMADAGADIVELDLPTVEVAIATYYVLANSEASANLARFDGIRYGHREEAGSLVDVYRESRSQGFGPEVKRRILLGTFSLSSGYYDAYYGRASAVAHQLRDDLSGALESCDALMTPTSPSSAFLLGERVDDPLAMYLSDVYTTPVSLAGLPALAVPSGLDDAGLPLSVQFVGAPLAESTILRLGAAVEERVGVLRPPRPEGL